MVLLLHPAYNMFAFPRVSKAFCYDSSKTAGLSFSFGPLVHFQKVCVYGISIQILQQLLWKTLPFSRVALLKFNWPCVWVSSRPRILFC